MEPSSTPFDTLVLRLTAENVAAVADPDVRKIFVLNQIQLLRVIYILMKQINLQEDMKRTQGQTSLTIGQFALERPINVHAVFLHYFTFINVLNQFGRALERHYGSVNPIPRYERILFFRNKVLEHWDDYTTRIPSSGFTQQGGKPAIPIIEIVYLHKERVPLLEKLLACFKAKGSIVSIADVASGQGTTKEYCNAIYQALEKIDSSLWQNFRGGGQHEDLIKLLFEFGFPAPVIDVDQYSSELLVALESYLV